MSGGLQMNTALVEAYKVERKRGGRAQYAIRNARVRLAWQALGGYEEYEHESKWYREDETGKQVRIMIRDDYDWEPVMDFDCKNTKPYQCDWRNRKPCAIHKREAERANREGVYGIEGQYRHPVTGEWIDADSVWGFIGDDWRGSGYDIDIMAETMAQLEKVTGC